MLGVDSSSFSSQSVSEKFEKPLLRLLQRIQEVVFLHLKKNVLDRRLRSLLDLDSNAKPDVVNFSKVQRMVRDKCFFTDHALHISLGNIRSNIDKESLCNASNCMNTGKDISVKRVSWMQFAFQCIAAIMRTRLPELCYDLSFIEKGTFSVGSLEAISTSEDAFLNAEPWISILNEVISERAYFDEVESSFIAREKAGLLKTALSDQPMVSGPWRKSPADQREYEKLDEYIATKTISTSEQSSVLEQLTTTLTTGFRGPAYNFDDGQLTEEWMCSFQDMKQVGPTDDDVIRVLTAHTLEVLLDTVQDRVCTDLNILEPDPLNIDSTSCKEQLVWGIDCSCRRLIEIVIISKTQNNGGSEEAVRKFIAYRLLSAINAQMPEDAHNMLKVAEYMCSMPVLVAPRGSRPWEFYTVLEHLFAEALLDAVKMLGIDAFRIHPKGTGVLCTAPDGIAPHTVVCEYLGELYPPYRWCEKLDVVKQAQKKFHLKPTLPDFYNILLERPRQDPNGYGVLFVDAAQCSNIGSTLAHSCENNCTSAVVSRKGRLTIVLTSSRFIFPGEEITHDYSAVTASEDEWRSSVCLCGMPRCRGTFLHYSDEGPVQRILEQHCGPLWRYAALLRACSQKPLAKRDRDILERHGFKSIALGSLLPGQSVPQDRIWMLKFGADMLHFIEHERAALPCALLRNQADFISTFVSADWDARMVMEQRIQSLCCTFSMVQRVLDHQPIALKRRDDPDSQRSVGGKAPLCPLDSSEIAYHLWSRLRQISPYLLEYAISIRSGAKIKSFDATIDPKSSANRLDKAAKEIDALLKNSPPNSHKFAKDLCLKVRNIIVSIHDLENRMHRFRLLSDMLAMWAHTSHFSSTNSYCSVSGEPLTVLARDLGGAVLRTHIEKFSQPESGDQNPATAVQCQSTSKFLSADDPVFTGRMQYDGRFVFWQLMQWFNAGSEKDVCPVDMCGVLQLPEPYRCFGACQGVYNEKIRKDFLALIRDEKSQALPWPEWLQACFSKPNINNCKGISDDIKSIRGPKGRQVKPETNDANPQSHFYESHLVCGSPMLDVCLGLTHAVRELLSEIGGIKEPSKISKTRGKRKRGSDADEHALQPDDVLPPEDNTQWVQCDLCHTWRRLPWYVDSDTLAQNWNCALNTWDPDLAICNTVGDTWDPDNEEIIDATGGESNSSLAVNSERDVLCLVDNIYYEGTVVKIKAPGEPADGKKDKLKSDRGDSAGGEYGAALFKFKFFGNTFREWIPLNSDRIRPLHMFSDASAKTLEQAQQYQGMYKTKGAKPKKMKHSNPFKGQKATTSFAADGTKKTSLKEIFQR